MGKWDGNVNAQTHGDFSVWTKEQDKRALACKVLGLDPDIDYHPDQIRATFKALVRENHPDNGGDGKRDMDALKQARDTLINHSFEKPRGIIATRCGVCNGVGSVRAGTGFQSIPCPSCHGSGEKS